MRFAFWTSQVIVISFAAVQSLNSLNDQIAQFMVTRPCSLADENESFIPGERDTLRKSMTLMRHLLVDAQVQLLTRSIVIQWMFVTFLPDSQPVTEQDWVPQEEFYPFIPIADFRSPYFLFFFHEEVLSHTDSSAGLWLVGGCCEYIFGCLVSPNSNLWV